MVQWLGDQETFAQTVAINCDSPCLEAALAATLTAEALATRTLHTVPYHCVPSPCWPTRSTSLTRCELSKSSQQRIDLGPLEALPSQAAKFVLKGDFENLASLEHLTGLQVNSANVSCNQECLFVTGLQQLEMASGTPQDFPWTDCTALQHLEYVLLEYTAYFRSACWRGRFSFLGCLLWAG